MRLQTTPVELVDVLAAVAFVGVGLTSLILALWPATATSYEEQVTTIVGDAAAELDPPDEILVAGSGLEHLIVSAEPNELALGIGLPTAAIRLVPDDAPVHVNRDRYWVVAREGRVPEVPEGYAEASLREHGELVLLEWTREAERASVRLSDRLRRAEAKYVGPDGRAEPCGAWRFGRIVCGPNEWNYVGVTEVIVRGKPGTCVWAHPLAGKELHVTFPHLPLGGGLRGRYALADSAIDDANDTPVDFRVLVDGKERVKRVVPSRRGWNRFEVRPDESDQAVSTVTFVVSAKHDGKRHFCFDAEIRPASTGVGGNG